MSRWVGDGHAEGRAACETTFSSIMMLPRSFAPNFSDLTDITCVTQELHAGKLRDKSREPVRIVRADSGRLSFVCRPERPADEGGEAFDLSCCTRMLQMFNAIFNRFDVRHHRGGGIRRGDAPRP
jgi:hypothetical protein